MKTHTGFRRKLGIALQKGTLNWHNRILLVGVCFIFIYAAVRLTDVLINSLRGSAGGLLLTAAGIGFYQLWQQRSQLQKITASDEDRLLGYILILSGAALYPFCLFAIWAQAIDCLVILAGIACSQWGLAFFQKYPFPIILIAVGILPKTTLIIEVAYQTFLPAQMLEKLMAQAASWILQLMGQPATAAGHMIVMPTGSVSVAYGCNGALMAITMAVASFVLGLFLKQSRKNIAIMVAIGAVLALITNVPRIMLMTLASVYWGDYWFHFWHDSWGEQIFVSALFTIYYYLVMAVVNKRPKHSKT